MKVTHLDIDGVMVLEPKYFEDSRGYFTESYSSRTIRETLGVEVEFVQDNHMYSAKKGTIRGIHFQNNPHSQIKLVRCVRGRVFDVAVDLRKTSKTYKKWVSIELSEDNRKQLWIPAGFGHALLTLTDNTDVVYKNSDLYFPEIYRAIAWNDLEIAIDWGTDYPILSEQDKNAPFLKDSDVNL